ncbi:hypothetical protein M409DRAFT_17797 [Zasmidium cellare ATCC 36951]|uniref:Uncharacterized protein n=1 Tax=Zasmidium cellare ATCC 36951 TaxID=1080233 RepID=A0A6A6D055_ZASCE|nr:uncharacterized protein M409DRAFT_17797 [Zasmidium cellare ATCC 36951]KAF2172565.1 hypothetical protein M409DRAFT_17797 [Zasmidium cellare ATCC 36951]
MPPPPKRTVLITGCSDGSLGAHLSLALHAAGWRVLATARNPSKLQTVRSASIETLTLDTLSQDSIPACVSQVHDLTNGSLDMLINNAGAGYSMPLLDVDLSKTRHIFELNVFSLITVTRAFVPLLRKSKSGGIIVNNTACSSLPCAALPFAGSYNASKAGAASLTEVLRLELAPFGIRVINLMTGAVKSTFHENAPHVSLPKDSLYNPAKERIERTMSGADAADAGDDPAKWAEKVAAKLGRKKVSHWVWQGKWTLTTWVLSFLPLGVMDGAVKGMTGIDVLEEKIREVEGGGDKSKAL